MVLKKSNSGLNTGATQRVSNGGTLLSSKTEFYSEKTIDIYLLVSSTGEKRRNLLVNYINMIWEKLGWAGPDVNKIIQNHLDQPFGFWVTFDLCLHSSMKKRKMWLLPNRIKSMMADMEFLQSIVPHVDIHVTEHRERPNIGHKKRIETKSIASKIISDAKPITATMRSKETRHFHNRGIQRPYLYTGKPKADKYMEYDEGSGSTILAIDVCESFHIDARCANKNNINRFKTKYRKKFKKSSAKSKGEWRNHVIDIMKDINDAISKQINFKRNQMTLCDSLVNNGVDKYIYDEVYQEKKSKASIAVSINDLIMPQKLKVKNPNKGKSRKEESENLRHASYLSNVVRYPKGSYITIPKEEPEIQSSSEIPNVEDLNDLPDTAVEPSNSERFDESDVSHSVKFEQVVSVEKEIEEFQLSCVNVALVIGSDEISEHNDNSIAGENVMVAKCYPPCVVVDFNNTANFDKHCYLVAKKTDMNSTSWHVTLQCENYIDANVKLQRALIEEWTYSVKLRRLIKIALDIMEIKKNLDSDKKQAKAFHSLDNIPSDTFVLFCLYEQVVPIICPQALTKINNDSHDVDVNKHFDVETHECPVCLQEFNPQERHAMKLLPCGHIFCLHCWQSHVYNSMRQGDNKCTCMAFKCDHLVDMATILALVPFHVIIKWQKQMLEKCIDTSPYCSWCPKATCPYVAWSPKIPLKTQFGIALTCKCSHSWCSSCRNSPHWPLSCEQMAAYNKLLEKSDAIKNISYGDTQYGVKLKLCPNCKYPIEKGEGCPYMFCSMCNKNFCWNCLKLLNNHPLSNCRANDGNYVTYSLPNRLVFDIPLKFLKESTESSKKLKIISSIKKKWLTKMKLSCAIKLTIEVNNFTKCARLDLNQMCFELEKCLAFLEKTLEFLDKLYLLLGFAKMNKSSTTVNVISRSIMLISQLDFILWRIENHIIPKSLCQVSKYVQLLMELMTHGETVLCDLVQMVPSIQNITKDVDAKSFGEIEPSKYLRYK